MDPISVTVRIQPEPAASALVVLVTPTDRHRDAERLTAAGMRVLATSEAESSARQILDARPAVIAIELVPSLSHRTLSLLSQLTGPAELRGIPLIVYGRGADEALVDQIVGRGAGWIAVISADRGELVTAVRQALWISAGAATT